MNSTYPLRSALLMAFVLVAIVPVVDVMLALFGGSGHAVKTDYSFIQMISGMVGESIRSLISVYLYATTEHKGTSLTHAMKYGVLYSLLVASLYVFMGAFYFELPNPLKFAIMDSIILLLQGVLSGYILYYTFRLR